MKQLYDHQNRILEDVSQAARDGHRKILIQLATGGGKSVIAAEFVRRAVAKGRKAAFLVPRRELVRQMDDTFNDFEVRHGFVAAGYTFNPHHRLHVCTVQTLANRLGRIDPDLIFVDEAHICGSQLESVMGEYPNAFLIGLSATPKRLDGKGLGRYYTHMVKGPNMRWLIDNGYLSDFRLFAPSSPDLSGIKRIAGDYAKGELAERMENNRVLVGDAVNHYKEHAMGRLGITYTTSRKHSEIVAQSFRDSGVNAMAIDGETPDDERKRIIKAFAKREILQLVNCELLTYGFDLASSAGMDVTVECMSDLQPTQSVAKQWQKNGRALRRKDFPAMLFDHAGNAMYHGMPDQEIEWSLNDEERKTRGSGDRNIDVMQCVYCYFCAKPFLTCPNCGRERVIQHRKVDQVDGKLEEMKQIQQYKKQARMEVGQARTIADLQRIAADRGYDKGWVWNMARVRGLV